MTIQTLFQLGEISISPLAFEVLPAIEIAECLSRHEDGNWGDVTDEEKRANTEALKSGGRLRSVFMGIHRIPVSIITEADRSATSIILPFES